MRRNETGNVDATVFCRTWRDRCLPCRSNGLRVTGGRVAGRQAGPGRAGCGPRPEAAPRLVPVRPSRGLDATGVSRASVRVNALVGPRLFHRLR